MATKKVLLSTTSGGGKNVIKLTAANKTGPKTIVTAGQKTQLHQINVPGKGIQYIRLVTNPTPAAPPSLAPAAPAPAPASTPAHLQNKTFVLSDGKGNVIHMTAEKMSQQPPPLVRTNTNKGEYHHQLSTAGHEPRSCPPLDTSPAGNVIHMTAEKMSQQPPPLVRTNTNKGEYHHQLSTAGHEPRW
ncbi:hypothetical protein O0L34_g594 [Tuta absoluta]|nr:hypothetical protein O0L34_g594 [Tuta absoluta]